jgi:hypothetical protein
MKKTFALVLALAIVQLSYAQNKKEQIEILNNRVDSLKIAFQNENSIKKTEIEKLERNSKDLEVQKNNLLIKIAELNASISEFKLSNYLLKDSLTVCLKNIIELDSTYQNALQKIVELNEQIELKNKIESTNFSNQNSNLSEVSPTILKVENSVLSSMEFLKNFDGKYPYEVNLLKNPVFIKRLKKLLGESRYNFLKKTWAVETPIKFANDIFVAEACQAHNCDKVNFIIVYDFSNNILYAGIKEYDNIKTYSEDGSIPVKINEWKYGQWDEVLKILNGQKR